MKLRWERTRHVLTDEIIGSETLTMVTVRSLDRKVVAHALLPLQLWHHRGRLALAIRECRQLIALHQRQSSPTSRS